MTPHWRRMMKVALRLGASGTASAEMLAKMRCFDLRGVEGLIEATVAEIEAGFTAADENEFAMGVDIGPSAVIPAENTWLEWSGLAAALIAAPGRDDLYDLSLTSFGEGGRVGGRVGRLVPCCDGYAVQLHRVSDFQPVKVRDWVEADRRAVSSALAALAIINSPRAERERVAPHEGLLRDAGRRATIDRSIVHTRVSIGGSNGEGASRVGSHSPKAYHFCRAHSRQLPTGQATRVRAHWRGDPAFGYRLPSYEVRAA